MQEAETKVRSKKDLAQDVVFITNKPAREVYPFDTPSEVIPSVCEVYDPVKKENRTAIYLIGQRSIWVDEIPAFKDGKKLEGSPIVLINGVKVVSVKERNLLEYLKVAGYNEANNETRVNSPVLYKEINFETTAENAFIKSKEIDSARHYVNNAPIREVRSYLLALQKTTDGYKIVQGLSEFEVRLSLRPHAEKNPKIFLESLKDSYLQNKARIINAIYEDVLVFDEKENQLSWKNGGVIIKAPKDIHVTEHFATLSIDSDKYMKLFNEVAEALRVINKKAPSDAGEIEESDPLDLLVTDAINAGIITASSKNMWFSYTNDAGDVLKFKVKRDLIEELKTNKDLVQELFRKTS